MPLLKLTDLPIGYEFPPAAIDLTVEASERYRHAVEDGSPLYDREGAPFDGTQDRPVSPAGVAALSLGALLQMMEIPWGLTHASQELEFLSAVRPGGQLTCRCHVRTRSLRRGNLFLGLEFTTSMERKEVLRGRTTLLIPVGVESATP